MRMNLLYWATVLPLNLQTKLLASMRPMPMLPQTMHDPVLVGLRLQTVPEPGSVLGFFLLGVWGLGSKRQRKKS